MSALSKPIAGKVVVTGASGFIGGQLRDALLGSGADVVSLVRPNSPPVRRGRGAAVNYTDMAGLREFFERERPDYVFHVAGATKGVTYADFHAGNVMPTVNVMRALRDTHPEVKRFVFVSSLTAYGPSKGRTRLRESDPREPVEHYGRSKLEAELAVEALGDALPWTIIRPPTVYGPAEVDMFTLFKAAHSGVNLFYGNREKLASAVYVDDLLDGMVLAAQSDAAVGRGYFLTDGESYTWEQIQRHIVAAVGRRTLTVSLPGFLVPAAGAAGELLTAFDKKPRLMNRQKAILDAQHAWLCSHDAASKDLGYAPRIGMAEGTRRAYRWYQENGWL
ncbi:MAG: NAD-dependent epimerase/dehydratase family protein [Myxococcales bacterium]